MQKVRQMGLKMPDTGFTTDSGMVKDDDVIVLEAAQKESD